MLSRARWSRRTAVLCSLALLLLTGAPLLAQAPGGGLGGVSPPTLPAGLGAVSPPTPLGGGVGISPPTPLCPPAGSSLPEAWGRADLLLWHVNGSGIPALVTASPPGTARSDAGVLTNPNTVTYFGNQHINNEIRPGFSVEAGWIGLGDPDYPVGVMAGFFLLESVGEGFHSSSDGSFTLARPFFNASTNNSPDARLISFPGELRGSVDVRTRAELHGAEFNVMQQIFHGPDYRVAAYIGYRYIHYRDRLWVQDSSEAIDPLSVPGTTIGTMDAFDADTTFHGCNFGLDFRYQAERLSFTLRTSLAVGYSAQVIRISGQTTTTVPPDGPVVSTGGLLALPTNIGEHRRADAAVLPQLGLTVGYAVTDHARVYLGYDFLYLSDVATAGRVVDIFVNPTQFPPGTLVGAARPAFFTHTDDLWATGLRVGVEVTY